MGTWKITKKATRDGKVCLRTEATDKLSFLIKQQSDTSKMVSFYEQQVELRDKYLKIIR